MREIDVTSYAEIVLAPPADDLAHPAFGKLFVETEYLADSAALLCHRAPARLRRRPPCGPSTSLSLEGRPQGPVEWETDRARFLGRGRDTDDPQALDGRALSGTTGVVLDPIFSLRQRIRLAPGALGAPVVRHRHRVESRDGEALAQKYRDPSAAARTFALALTQRQSGLRHLGISTDEALLFERLASRVLYADGSLRARGRTSRANALGQAALWPHGISGDLPILLVRVGRRRRTCALVRQVLQAQEYWRLQGPQRRRRHPQRASRRAISTRCTQQLTALLDDGPWRDVEASPGRRVPAARAIRWARPSARCSPPWPRAILRGDRGDLRDQLDRPYPATRAAARPSSPTRPREPALSRADAARSRSPR